MRCERQQLGIFAIIAVMIGIFALQQYGPLRNRIHTVEQVKAAQLSAGTMTDEQAKRLPALTAQLEQVQKTVGNYDVKIPTDRKLGTFLQEIAEIMNKHDLREQMVQPDSEMQADDLTCIPVRIQGKGTVQQLFGFFRSLQTVDRLMRIEQVQLKNAPDLSGLVTMTAKANIYYRTPQSQNGGR